MITITTPQDWKDLQLQVARILSECGLETEVEKTVATVRGKVELDVYATEEVAGRRYTVICECKYWRAPIPQQVIHGFRTVVGDIGAHKGYIISLNGFQAGSFAAADATNIELLDWVQFQATFEASWLRQYFSPLLLKRLSGLMAYAEGFVPAWLDQLSEDEAATFLALQRKHRELGWMAQHLAMIPVLPGGTRTYPPLPLAEGLAHKYDMQEIPPAIATAEGWQELLEAFTTIGGSALMELQKLRDLALGRMPTK